MDKWIKRLIYLGLMFTIVLVVSGSYMQLVQMHILPILTWGTIQQAFQSFFALYIFLIMVFIFFEHRDPHRMISWLVVLALVPVVGFVFYILFGRNIAKKRRTKRKRISDMDRMEQAASFQMESVDIIPVFTQTDRPLNRRLVRLLMENASAPFFIRNQVEVLTNGVETFQSILEALEEAQEYIHLQYFIIRDDVIGNQVKNLLIKKAQEGVKVRIIYDSVGCWKLGKKYKEALRHAGIEIHAFFPVAFPILSRELNYRNHRKIIVIDGKTGFLGGLNIGDEYLGANKHLGFWRDTHMKICGEAVYGLQNSFLDDWKFVSGEALDSEEYFPKVCAEGTTIMQVVSSGPDSEWKAILQAYFLMISGAQERVWIASPYLVPEDSLMTALKASALSGVDVRIVIPSKPDHFFVYWASRDNIEELLEAGVKIYEYEKGFIHSKVIIVDDQCGTVGTANLDIRSLEINFEANAFLYDQEVIRRLEVDFLQDFEDSRQLQLRTHMERPRYQRLLESLGRLVSPLQ